MIQRIQNLYVFFIFLISILFFNLDIISNLETKFIKKNITKIIFIINAAIAIFTIVMYKNRKIQVKLLRIATIINLSAFFYFLLEFITSFTWNKVIISFIFIIKIFLIYFAIRGIKRDDNIIKSYNSFR